MSFRLLKTSVSFAVLLILAASCYSKTLYAQTRQEVFAPCRQDLFVETRQDTSSPIKEIVISGKVSAGESSSPLEGAGILVKGTKNITGTQIDGTFTLLIRPEDKVLIVTAEGYKPQEIPITRSKEYYVVLMPSDNFGNR